MKGNQMLRIDKVYQALSERWANKRVKDLQAIQGTTALEVANDLGISRANASLELNKLVRDGRAIKITTYPVRFLPKETVEVLLDRDLPDITEVETVADLDVAYQTDQTDQADQPIAETYL